MMTKIAINGFGRIGRAIFKVLYNNKAFQVAQINDLADKKTLEYLLKHDSVYGKSDYNLNDIEITANKEPCLKADIVIESTGRFANFEDANKHNAKLVIITAPAKNTSHFVYGVNHEKYNQEKIISAGSCTTTALAHMVKKLHDNFKIINGFMTTVHSYTNDQQLLDLPHKDLRRSRAAALSIIPTTTGAAQTVEKVIPELAGKLDGIALRVPTPIVSIIDFICQVEKKTDKQEVNSIFENKTNEQLVSIDFKGDSRAVIIDTELTMVKDNLVKVLGWYDNEWGYSAQLVKLLEYIAKQFPIY
ncbi:MAG: type I glyceraldehyde-3-phosphate dehydrogenase [bacterium]